MTASGPSGPRLAPAPGAESPPERSWYADVDDLRVHARGWLAADVPARPPVVLVHGLGVGSRMCQPVARRLALRHHVYAPDLPGFGRSTAAEVLGIDGHADALAGWMNAVGTDGAVVVGVSVGSQVAAALAQRHPARCRLLVLGSPTVDSRRRSWGRQLPLWQVEQATQSLRMRAIQVSDYARAGARRVVRTFAAALDDRLEERLPDVGRPVLVCWGTRDPLLSRRWVEAVAAAAPQGRLAVLPGALHALSHESPLEFARVILHGVDQHFPHRTTDENQAA